jgi:hypothetical protein
MYPDTLGSDANKRKYGKARSSKANRRNDNAYRNENY